MNVVVFGATGATGRLVVEFALSAGHFVTAFVREPARMRLRHSRLSLVPGDVMNPDSVTSAVIGADAVICTLGTMPEAKEDSNRRQPGVPVCSVGTKNILAAMPHTKGRLVVESSASVGDSHATGVLGAGFIVRLALKAVMADKEIQEDAIRKSTCDWTIVRPVKLTNKPARGTILSGTDLRWNITSTATRADVASYIVQSLADASTHKKAITLRN